MERTAAVLRHLAFEDLDALESVLEQLGFTLSIIDVPTQSSFQDIALSADLLVVLGGPIGVYQTRDYPFLADEINVVRARLASGRRVLGICLGAQIMAAALGARVYSGTQGKEIGWSPLQVTPDGMTSPLRSLAQGQPVLHWHGDTFDLPDGSTLLASTNQYPHQAFIYGEHGLALQFHIEASATGLERWYVGHTGELSAEGIDVNDLRTQGQVAAPTSNGVLFGIMDEFLGGLPPAN